MSAARKRLLVVGNGMVGHHFLEAAEERGLLAEYQVQVLAEENCLAYDRVHLSEFFSGKSAEDLSLVEENAYEEAGIEVFLAEGAARLDLAARTVETSCGRVLGYDTLVLATGSHPFVPKLEGRDLPGCFVYRTLDDLRAIAAMAPGCRRGAVIGGGLLGLEAANALLSLGLETHVVELAPRLMPLQVDEIGGDVLRAHIERLGVSVHLAKNTRAIAASEHGAVRSITFADGTELDVDMVVFSAGIRPRDELAREAGLTVGERGGIVVDEACRTSDPNVFAIGECALAGGKIHGLVAPGYRMAEVVAGVLGGESERFLDVEASTKLKLLGVDVASFGDAFGHTAGAKIVSIYDGVAGAYKKLVLSEDKKKLLGGMLVGDASRYSELLAYSQNGLPLPEHPEDLVMPPRPGAKAPGLGVDALPESAIICSCHNVEKGAICRAIRDRELGAVSDVKKCTKAGSGCGSCTTLLDDLLRAELERAGVSLKNYLCEHFQQTRQELFHLVKVHEIRTFDELLSRFGTGDGCEICKPAVASILASTFNDHVLKAEHAGLQDTNDRFLANVQRDGTYSIVPRVAAGEITPDQLITLGVVAKKYQLYTKITGGQRIDMFGARLEQLPRIWEELVAAGFESGHAYGKALRTVKSCVGSTWCRYGVQNSVALALRIENRYKGLRSPHKIKGAVSGCARECAEAQSKDFGVIATEQGFNLYLCGNGGMKPQHAVLFATDLDADTVIRYLDRFLMFYIRTADRLQRTATWLNKLEGGIEYLRQVIVDDSLGICDELEAAMEHLVDTYRCEWKATLEDPEALKRFRPFVNSDEPDPSIVFVAERNQQRPAFWTEKQTLLTARRVRLPVLRVVRE